MRVRLTRVHCFCVGVGLTGLAGFAGLGCSPASPGGSSASGSVALSRDDGLVYAADPDLDAVFVFDTQRQVTVGTIAVGRQPEKVLLAPDGTLYVANRLGRGVSVIRPNELTEAARLPVGVEPMGLAVTADGRTLYVVNSTSLSRADVGTVMAFDTATLERKWELAVGPEPRAIALLADGRAAVTLYKAGDLVLVDLTTPAVLSAGTDVSSQLNRSLLAAEHGPLSVSRPGAGLVRPGALELVAPSRDGQHLFVAATLASSAVVSTPQVGAVGRSAGYASSGACGATAVVAPGLLTFDGSGRALVDDLSTCQVDATSRPATLLRGAGPGASVQGPRALASDPTGSFLYLANFGSDNVAIVSTVERSAGPEGSAAMGPGTIAELVAVGAGPSGIAVTSDGAQAWVHNALDHSLTRLASRGGRVTAAGTFALGGDVLPADVVAGRRLFFGAVDPRMLNPSAGLACASCHLEGREDGRVWNFEEGPRQTPSLAGRRVLETAPFHWNGEFDDLTAFMGLTIPARMGGSGATPAMERQLAAFLDWQGAPDNPHRGASPERLTRGRAAFDKAQCGSCHAGALLTDNTFADVGTLVVSGPVADRLERLPFRNLNTPSLLGVARTAPYLHDGSAPSLKARILQGKDSDRHGLTSGLSDAEVDDLVGYLETL